MQHPDRSLFWNPRLNYVGIIDLQFNCPDIDNKKSAIDDQTRVARPGTTDWDVGLLQLWAAYKITLLIGLKQAAFEAPYDSRPKKMQLLLLQALAGFLLACLSAVVRAAPTAIDLAPRDVWLPPVLYPNNGTVWIAKQRQNVTWCVSFRALGY